MDDDERAQPISALPLQEWLSRQERGAKAALARKLRISHGRLSNWFDRGIPARKVSAIAHAMGIDHDQYLARAGALPEGVQPTQGRLETTALLADFEALPDGLKAYIATQAAELREIYESVPNYVRVGLKKRPDAASYPEWERAVRELMATYQKKGEE